MATESEDQRILILAAEIAEAHDSQVPKLLLEVKDVLDSEQNKPRDLTHLRLEIWNYEILQVLILVLKQNFEFAPGGWKTAAKLTKFASVVCIGLDPPDSDTHAYLGICLPNTSENMLMLARKMQVIYTEQARPEQEHKEMLNHFREVIEALNTLFSAHIFLTLNVLRSPWLLQMLISDDADTTLSVLNLVQYAITVNTQVLNSLDEKVIHALLDELVFKLTSGEDKFVAGSAIKCLLLITQVRAYYVQIICKRYRGLRPLINKWAGQGLGRDFKDFTAILDAGNAHRVEAERFHRAATLIQAVYRSFMTRRRLRKANTALTKFHRSFRARQAVRERDEDTRKEETALQHQLIVARKQAMRQTREKTLQVLGMLPAASVPRYLEDVRDRAALTIQTCWRGSRVRQELQQRKKNMRRIRAVIKIQRRVRKYLSKLKRLRSEPPTWTRPDGLTDERRVYLQNVIKERRETNPPRVSSREDQEALHTETQSLLKRHVFSSRANMRRQVHRTALLAQLEQDSELILNCPKLSEIQSEDIDKYRSISVPISLRAKELHVVTMKRLGQPWWKKLAGGDEELGGEGGEGGEEYLLHMTS